MSSPIDLSLFRRKRLPPYDPFFQVIPHAIGRLKSLSIRGDRLQDITAHLSHPAPLLEYMSIHGGSDYMPRHNPVLTPTLFNGDLSSLHELYLEYVRTELPWRNMVNLTSFMLAHTSPGEVSVRHLLDFFEGAPRLREVDLYFAAPTFGTQNGRLVSLPSLRRMDITGSDPSSLLLDHLLIPVGACLTIEVQIEDHPPRFLGNLRNFSNFATVRLYDHTSHPQVQFNGPNGQVNIIPRTPQLDWSCLVFKSLARFDTSKAEQLKIDCGKSPSSGPPYRALLPMKALRTLTLYLCETPHVFVQVLDPNSNSTGVVVCPVLEELVIEHRETLDIKHVIGMAMARASRGAKLKSVRMVSWYKFVRADVLELKKYVSNVECGLDVCEED